MRAALARAYGPPETLRVEEIPAPPLGARNPDELPDDLKECARYHRQERGYGKFSRTLQLPFPVSISKIEANFKHGVLSVSLPRAEEDKPRKIAVKSA